MNYAISSSSCVSIAVKRTGGSRSLERGPYGERPEREPIMGVWGKARGTGQSPWSVGQGALPPEADEFSSKLTQILTQICSKFG